MRYGFLTLPLLSGNLTHLDLSNLWLFCAALMTLYLQSPFFLNWNTRQRGLAASQLLHLLVCWISKGRSIFALLKHNVPRSGLYIMSRYEKAASRVGAHEINTYWPLAPSEPIYHDSATVTPPLHIQYQLMELQDAISWTHVLLILELMFKVLG